MRASSVARRASGETFSRRAFLTPSNILPLMWKGPGLAVTLDQSKDDVLVAPSARLAATGLAADVGLVRFDHAAASAHWASLTEIGHGKANTVR